MSFNTKENIVFAENPSLSVGTGPIVMDTSSISEVTYQFQTNTAGVSAGVGFPVAYNGIETIFDVRIPAGARVLFDKSYVRMNGIAADMNVGIGTNVPIGVSIPWNSIAAILDTAEVQLNQNATTTEQINQNLGDGSMVKILTRYSREMIEHMSDSFFTPCIESIRDYNNGLLGASAFSPESLTRRVDQLIDAAGPQPHAKNLYLSDIFDSLRVPAAFFLQNLQFKFRPKQITDILFTDPGYLLANGFAASLPRYFVTNMTLFLTMVNLSENQLIKERERIMSNESMLRESFSTFDAIQKTHSQSASYRDSNVKNLQAAVFLFPSRTAADAVGANPYQYCYGSGAGGATGISAYQMRYDNVYSPAQPLTVATVANHNNTDLFFQYKLLTRRSSDREVTLALDFVTAMANPRPVPQDHCPYVMFCAQFYPLNAYAHKTMAGADHEIITAGGAAEPIIIVRIRSSFLEIRGDTSVYMIN